MEDKVKEKPVKLEWLWAVPITKKPLQLTDPSIMIEQDDGSKEAFAVAWNEKELDEPKEVPNSETFAGYAEIKHIKFVNKPKSSKKEPTKEAVKDED